MDTRQVILFIVLVLGTLYTTRVLGIWGAKKGVATAKKNKQATVKTKKGKKKVVKRLGKLREVSSTVGTPLDLHAILEYRYRIERNNLFLKTQDRYIEAEELDGILKLVQISGVCIGLVLCVSFRSIVPSIFLISLFARKILFFVLDSKIREDDKKLDEQFYNFFVILRSNLKKGANTRLSPAIVDYISILDATHLKNAKKMPIRRFANEMLNLINIYSDDIQAVKHLREKYRSALIVNFINISVQAMAGIDNGSKLDAFSSELCAKNKLDTERRGDKNVAKAQKTILLVYVILVQFILLSFASKIDIGLIKGVL